MMKGKKQLTRSAFLKRIRDTIKRYDMLDKGDRVLAAVSGGADSICLLNVLVDMRRTLGIEVIVGNMDHGLRGAESERDSEFVSKLSEKLGLKFVHKKVKLISGGDRKKSTEERAREVRYAFLRKSAADNDCNVIATGHTMDDQAETVLMRFIYGASPAGITGIPPVRYERDKKIVRPLIRTGRRDILAYLNKNRSEYVEDSSNRDVRFLRNKLRQEVLPFLEKYNPRVRRSIVNFSDSLREDLLFLSAEKKKSIRRAAGSKKNSAGIKIRDMLLQPAALKKEIFKELFRRAGGEVKKLTYRHWMDMDHFLKTSAKNKSLDLPGSVRVTKRGNEIVFEKRPKLKS